MVRSHYVHLPQCKGADNYLPSVTARYVPIRRTWRTSELRHECNALGACVRHRQKPCHYSWAFSFHLVPCPYRMGINRKPCPRRMIVRFGVLYGDSARCYSGSRLSLRHQRDSLGGGHEIALLLGCVNERDRAAIGGQRISKSTET